MSTVVPTLCWVRKGVAKKVPDKVELTREEVEKFVEAAQHQLKSMGISDHGNGDDVAEASVDGGGGEGGAVSVEEMYDLEHYDSDSEEEGVKVSGAGMGDNLAGLTYHASNNDDPYITLKNVPVDDEDAEDHEVQPTDNLLVVGRAEEDFSSIEIHVFSEADDHSHSHHEILLTSFPLALEWLDFDPEQPELRGNYVAIGTMTPVMEVWDLDTIDVLEPVFCLGDRHDPSASLLTSKEEGKKKKKKKKKKKDAAEVSATEEEDGHSEAVLGISWNSSIRNILASASADRSVRVWDLAWPKTVLVLPHPEKVQCCLWHPYESQLLATGAYDGVVRLFDCKSSESAVQSWNVEGEVEKLIWNQFKPEQLLASSENQRVWCLNKSDGSVVFQIHAHHSDVVDLSLSCYMPGLLVTAGTDDCIKFWDIQENKPVFLLSRDMHMGGVMCSKFCVDSPYALAVGGNKNGFHLINVLQLPDVVKRFKKRDMLMPMQTSSVDSGMTTPTGKEHPRSSECGQVTAAASSDVVSDEDDSMDLTEGGVAEAEAAGAGSGQRVSKSKKKKKKHKAKHGRL